MSERGPGAGAESSGAGAWAPAIAIGSASSEETEAVARRLGEHLAAGDVVALVGDLGAGKTVFVRGLAGGLGVSAGEVASPTFTMVAVYHGRLPLYHVDLYRLDPQGADLEVLREYVYGGGVTAIEWFDRLPDRALDAYLLVRINYGEPGRCITLEGRGQRAASLIETLAGGVQS